jgi:hypothetical protein
MKTLIIASLTLVLGFLIGYFTPQLPSNQISDSWKRIDNYHAYLNEPSNYETNGSYVEFSPPDIGVDLALLLQAGELERTKVIIPEIPNTSEYVIDWATHFQDKYPDVVEVSGPGSYQNGEIPLMFEVWHKPSYKKTLNLYIQNLKNKEMRNRESGGLDSNTVK